MGRALVLAALLAAIGCGRAERPRPLRTVVCAGDSNTGMQDSWCDMLARELPEAEWRFVNVSRSGTRAAYWAANDLGKKLVAPLRPDVVVLALGTNDVWRTSPAGIVDALLTLAIQSSDGCGAGRLCPRVVIATIPPLFQQPPIRNYQSTIDATNALLEATWPPNLIADFDSWVTGPEWYWPDGIHLTDDGQHRRAAEARNAIYRALAD
jgi:lysophospholipase L1-like esterase